jgi:hypothetical protein
MVRKFFYLFKVKGDIPQIEDIDESPLEIDGTKFQLNFKKNEMIRSLIENYFFNNQTVIGGNVTINDDNSVPFKIRSKSKLLFIETPYPREKLRILKFFNNKFKKLNIETFIPSNKYEMEFICKTAKLSSFKVFIDDKIVRSEETDKDICNDLKQNMEIIEATLDIPIKNKDVTFYYYGNAIQFPNQESIEIEGVIQTFENTMIAHAK